MSTFNLKTFLPALSMAESGGNSNAKSKTSSATGTFQYTAPTWAAASKLYPDLGLTPDNINDTGKQAALVQRQTENEYVPALNALGADVSNHNVYLMHHMGQGVATKLLQASDDTPASQAIGAAWGGIQGANRALFPDTDMTAGDVRNAVATYWDKAAGNTPQDADTGAQDSVQPEDAPAAPATATLAPDSSSEVPDAPDLKAKSDPNAGRSWLDNLVSGLADWGAGANGSDFAAGLGQGAKNVMEGVHAREAQSQAVQDFNDQLPTLNWDNKVKTASLRNAIGQQDLERQKAIAGALVKGVDPATAVALFGGKGGTIQAVDPRLVRAQSGEAPDSYEAPQQWVVNNPDGSQSHFIQSINKRTGQPLIKNMTTGETQGTLPEGAYQPNAAAEAETAKLSAQDFNDFQKSRQDQQDMVDHASNVVAMAPFINAGPGMGDRLARSLATLTGQSHFGTDADKLNYANQEIEKVRKAAISSLRGRSDLPMVNNALKSSSSLMDQPDVLYHVEKEMERSRNLNDSISDGWNNLSDGDPYRRRGFAAYRSARIREDADANTKEAQQARFDADRAEYADYAKQSIAHATAAEQARSGTQPTTAQPVLVSPSARVGAPQQQQPANGQSWSNDLGTFSLH